MIAADACEVSGATERVTGLELVPSRLSVRPGTKPVTVFDALEIEFPLTVSDALAPGSTSVNPNPVYPEVVTVKSDALPEALLTSDSQEPLASVMTLALTPRLSPLI